MQNQNTPKRRTTGQKMRKSSKKRKSLSCLFVVKKRDRETFKATIVPIFQQSKFKNKLKVYQNFKGKTIEERQEDIIVLDEPSKQIVHEIATGWRARKEGRGILIVLTVQDNPDYIQELREIGAHDIIDKLTISGNSVNDLNKQWENYLKMEGTMDEYRGGPTESASPVASNSPVGSKYKTEDHDMNTTAAAPNLNSNNMERLSGKGPMIPTTMTKKPFNPHRPTRHINQLSPGYTAPQKKFGKHRRTHSNGSNSSARSAKSAKSNTGTSAAKKMFDPISCNEEIPVNIYRFTPDSSWCEVDFDAFDFSLEQLRHHILWSIHHLGFDRLYGVKLWKFYNLLLCIERLYMNIPYHSIRHAYDVTEYVLFIITKGKLDTYMPKFDLLCSIVTALMHDLNHLGFNNNFLADTDHRLSRTYNDKSPLEQHHCTLAFRALRIPECAILESVTPAQFKHFRKHMIEIILATDMINHTSLLKEFEKRFKDTSARQIMANDVSDYDILCIQKLMMKTCDVSNVSRGFHTAVKWAERIIEEFCIQGDLQLSKGLPTETLFNRHQIDFPSTQLGFITYVAMDQFRCFVRAFPEMAFVLDRVNEINARWKSISKEKTPDIVEFETTLRTRQSSTSDSSVLEASCSSASTEELFSAHEPDHSPPIICKVHYPNALIRKFRIQSTVGLQAFREIVSGASPITDTDRLFYADADNDWILIEGEESFSIAKEDSLNLIDGRLTLRITKAHRKRMDVHTFG